MPAPTFPDLGEWRLRMRTRTVKSARSPLSPSVDDEALTHRLHAPPKLLELAVPDARGVAQLPFAAHWRSFGRARAMASPVMEFEWRGRGGPVFGRPSGDAESQFWIEISGSGSRRRVARSRLARRVREGRGVEGGSRMRGRRE
jgi:hypothetical protein